MSFDAGAAVGTLSLDVVPFVKAIQRATGSIDDLVSSTQKGGLAAGLETGFTAAIGAVTAGVVALSAAVGIGSVKQAEAEKSIVGLSNVLRTQGVPAYAQVTQQIDAFATALQRSTGVSAESIIDVSKQLVALGVETRNLKPAVQTVLDFSAAFGVDATTAARQFGQALNGNAGALGKYLPEVKKLTKEQLAAGEAFRIAAAAVNGQAEALGNTFGGQVARLVGSVEDLLKRFGAAFNEAFGPLVVEIQGVVDLVTDSLGEGSTGFTLMQTAAQAAAAGIKSSFAFVVGLGAEFLLLRAQVLETFAAIQTAVVSVGTVLNSLEGGLFIGIQNMATATANFLAQIPLIGEGLAAAFHQVAADAAAYVEKLGQAEASQQALVASANAAAAEAGKAAANAASLSQRVSEANASGKSLATQVKIVADNFGIATANANGTAAATQRATTAVAAAVARAQGLVDIWKDVNDAAQTTTGAVNSVTSATHGAAAAADDLADSWDDVAASAGAAAGAAAAAGGGGGGGQSFSQQLGRQGSSTALDFSDPFRAAALAQQAISDLDRIGSGAKRADIGFAGVNAARAFADDVVAQAQQSIDRAVAEFTAQVLAELNAQGIVDPTARSRIVRERLAEARRFGILPDDIQYQTRTF
jgi:hypothetical protein